MRRQRIKLGGITRSPKPDVAFPLLLQMAQIRLLTLSPQPPSSAVRTDPAADAVAAASKLCGAGGGAAQPEPAGLGHGAQQVRPPPVRQHQQQLAPPPYRHPRQPPPAAAAAYRVRKGERRVSSHAKFDLFVFFRGVRPIC